ncbi:butyrophilin subfamily 1 member A1-like [Ctenopharyngodon idella]|uniref:butyrophilin subfamily 1 member A1-like n=1 Tax=Ctenopharyngodon idella TaxID=7959 RepID=UPI00222FE2C3|nr:butyrophilin subfamily 1 member A1-like [Ctenopharyngodon idella]
MKFICLTLLLVSGITDSRSEQYEVVGPADPVFAVAGEDVILPCSIKPNVSVVDMRVEWLRLDQKDSLVHLYEGHEDRNTDQIQSYRGRTKLNHQELQRGNASLKLSAVQISDEGLYKCFIQSKSWYDDATVDVSVEAVGSPPVITVDGFDRSGGLHLQCESEGWNPEPDVEWLDSEGVSLSSETTETHRNTDGFSVKHTVTVYHSNDKIHCRIKLRHHMLETLINTSNNMFHSWRTSVILISVVVVLIVIAGTLIAAFAHKYRAHKQLQNEKNRIETEKNGIETEKNRIETEKNRIETEKNRIETEKNEIETEKNRIETEKNEIETEKNRIETEKNEIETEKNRIETEKNEIETEKNRIETENNEIETKNNEIETEKNRIETEKNEIETEKNRIETEKNRIETEKNRIETEKNEIEKEKNKIETEKNRVEKEKNRIQHERDQLLQSLKTIIKQAVTHLRTHRVNVILDADSAHPRLVVSEDGKQVRDGNREGVDGKYRFKYYLGVLGKDGFSSRSFYFEVQVKDQTEWYLGVARQSSNRKNVISLSPDDGYWTVGLSDGKYWTRDSSHDSLSLTVNPQRVGVFVDYEKRLVSFYDVESMSHIHSFTDQSFTGKLYPFVCLGIQSNHNSTPLIICD